MVAVSPCLGSLHIHESKHTTSHIRLHRAGDHHAASVQTWVMPMWPCLVLRALQYLSMENMSHRQLFRTQKTEIIKQFQRHPGDVGSPAVTGGKQLLNWVAIHIDHTDVACWVRLATLHVAGILGTSFDVGHHHVTSIVQI